MNFRALACISTAALATTMTLSNPTLPAQATSAPSSQETVRSALNDISLEANADGVLLQVVAKGWTSAPANVAYEVTSPTGITKWYQAYKQANGSWSGSIDVGRDYATWGTYRINAWATIEGKTAIAAVTQEAVAQPNASKVNASVSGTTVSFAANGWTSDPSNVAFAVQSYRGTIRWFQAYKQPDGSWTANVDATTQLDAWGVYTATVYATFGATTYHLSSSSATVNQPSTVTTATESDGTISISAGNWTLAPSNVAFEIIPSSGGAIWIQATSDSNGTWSATVDADKQIKHWGSTIIKTWATFSANTMEYAQNTVVVSDPGARGATAIASVNGTKVSAVIKDLPLPSATTNAAIEAVSPSGKTSWIQAAREADGSWGGSFDAASVFGEWGTYRANLWVTVEDRTFKADTAEASVVKPIVGNLTAQADETGFTRITASDWSSAPDNVAFAVTSPTGSVRWYQAVEKNATWTCEAPLGGDFGEWGAYKVSVWATFGKSTLAYSAVKTNVDKPSPTISATANGLSLDLKSAGWSATPSNVAFAVSSPSGTVKWYQATRQSDGSWTCVASAAKDLGEWGSYTATAWATFGSHTNAWGSTQAGIAGASVSYTVRRTTNTTASGSDGNQASGWDGSAARGLSALKVTASGPVSGGIAYQVRQQDVGWSTEQSDGIEASTNAVDTAFSAIRIKLTGDLANYCDVWYRTFAKGYDWLGWTKNGATSGSTNLGLEIQSIQIVLKPKGSAAPGSTSLSDVVNLLPTMSTGNPKWIGARYFSMGREGRDWDYMVIHISECTTLSQIDNTFLGTRQASAHFGVGAGAIHQYVDLSNTAWAVGNWFCNTRSVSIEHVGTTGNPPSRAVLNTSAELMATLAKQKGWNELVLGVNVGIHKWYSATSCPASLDVRYLVSKANEYLGNGFTYKESHTGPAWLESSAGGNQRSVNAADSLASALSESIGIASARQLH